MIRPIVISEMSKLENKKLPAKKVVSNDFVLPKAKNLKSLTSDCFVNKGPFCGIDYCAV